MRLRFFKFRAVLQCQTPLFEKRGGGRGGGGLSGCSGALERSNPPVNTTVDAQFFNYIFLQFLTRRGLHKLHKFMFMNIAFISYLYM